MKVRNSLGYKVVIHIPYCDCGTAGIRDREYDSYYCPVCNKWLEPECSCKARGDDCSFPDRPEKPL
jgi:hypothetical protein